MFNTDFFDLLFDPRFLVTVAAGILAFATIVTLGMPLLERDTLGRRLKAVSERREELRARHKETLGGRKGTALRSDPVGSAKLIKQISDRFDLGKLVASEDTQFKLQQAGLRGPHGQDLVRGARRRLRGNRGSGLHRAQR